MKKTYNYFALITILFFIGTLITINFLMNLIQTDSTIVNISGRQRVLSQLISKNILTSIYNLNINKETEKFYALITEFESNHKTLMYNKNNHFFLFKSIKLQMLYDSIQPYYDTIIINTRQFINSTDLQKTTTNITNVLNNDEQFLTLINKIVYEHVDNNISKAKTIKILLLILFILIFIILFLNYKIFIKPILSKLSENLKIQEKLNHILLEKNEEYASLNEEYYSQNEEYYSQNEELREKNEEYVALNEEYTLQNEDLLEAKNKADESDKLKTAFLSNMSHEIRTPLNGIIGFTELLTRKQITDIKKIKYLKIINSNCSQLLTIIDDLIDVAKIESNQLNIFIESVEIEYLLKEFFNIYKLKLSNEGLDVNLILDESNNSFTVKTDKNRIRQVIVNLLNNAIKFTSCGEIHFGVTLKSNFLEFYVKDNGIGIEAIYLDKIFDRFWQVEKGITRKYGGSGIGLSICKAIIEKLGGKIWVESEVKVGSTFYFTIPYYKDEKKLENKYKENYMNLSDNYKNTSVLIAEDEDMNYCFFEEMLEDFNVKIFRAKNGYEAVEMAKSIIDLKLILMDIKMPEMNGYEATKLIKQFKPDLPIIAQTAYAQTGDKEKALQSGCNEYVSKPVDIVLFNELLAKYLNI